MVFQPQHVPEAVMAPPKMWTRPRFRPLRNDPNAIIRAARRRERRSITRARNIVLGWNRHLQNPARVHPPSRHPMKKRISMAPYIPAVDVLRAQTLELGSHSHLAPCHGSNCSGKPGHLRRKHGPLLSQLARQN